MPKGIQQTRAALRELPPLEWKVSGWRLVGFLCMVASGVLSVAILAEVWAYLRKTGLLEGLPFLG